MKIRRKMRLSRTHAIAWIALIFVVALGFAGFRAFGGVITTYDKWTKDLPQINSDSFNFASDSYMYASDGTTLLAKFQLEKRNPVGMDAISSYVVRGTIDVEDVRFY